MARLYCIFLHFPGCSNELSKLFGAGNSLFVQCLCRIWVSGSCCSVTGVLACYSCTNNKMTERSPSVVKEWLDLSLCLPNLCSKELSVVCHADKPGIAGLGELMDFLAIEQESESLKLLSFKLSVWFSVSSSVLWTSIDDCEAVL